ncbi:MAG: GatB/YqeY domain-containing protein [Candidatus Pacebacteria bacterium]|nr:GatB/YqeY domain-containing protein [Candidatus Paceibacterota bacterium]
MTLQEQMKENMKAAMKERNMAAVTTYRGLMSAMTNAVVAEGKAPDTPVSDDMAMDVLTKESKKRKDAIKQFEDAGRPELAEDEKAELAIIEAYLPEMMSKEDIKVKAEAKIAELGDGANKGQVMGALMGELKGQADGNDVKEVVDELLG